ncbi:MAG: tRNA preQ1(34) S-adenosylmethionine ribosyltransferase-isomerase QueA [Planctomycetota bacterium]|jgi:S-adenosylmethionine:tRNA ribosyltransferase-isomerase
MRSDTFNLEVPSELIAQTPATKRDESRLMVVHRGSGLIEHRTFKELPEYLNAGDLLLMNNTRVTPCRIHGRKEGTGGHVELFILNHLSERDTDDASYFEALTGSWRNVQPGQRIELPGDGGFATLLEKSDGGHWLVSLDMSTDEAEAYIARAAKMPLPPYIKRERDDDKFTALDRERYQTVFAEHAGAVAAPTSGLHFTPEIFDTLRAKGVRQTFLTLHVGPGTFRPLKAETLEEHPMHSEDYEISEETCADIESARAAGGRVVVVGTTSCRTIETVCDDDGNPRAGQGSTDKFIYPPYEFKCTDALITNFHLPHSTLIFLVAAFLGEDLTRQAYMEAIDKKYRFFSYGDSMLCLP